MKFVLYKIIGIKRFDNLTDGAVTKETAGIICLIHCECYHEINTCKVKKKDLPW